MIATLEGEPFDIAEASIADLQELLDSRALTSVELVSKYLHRISAYSYGYLFKNPILWLNPRVFVEAAASDQRRAKGQTIGFLDGIPYLVQDARKKSFPLAANNETNIVRKLRHAGAVLIGQTNMASIVAGGMHQFKLGRAVCLYKPACHFASFESSLWDCSAIATAISFATLGVSEETINQARLQVANNALVTYIPSRDVLSLRDNWPLRSARTVIVTRAKSVEDIVTILDAVSANDATNERDILRKQCLTHPSDNEDPVTDLLQLTSINSTLKGVRIAAPMVYSCHTQLPDLPKVHTQPEAIALYQKAKADMEVLGAEVIEISSFPLTQHYESPICTPKCGTRLPKDCDTTKRSIPTTNIHDELLRISNETNGSPLFDLMRKQYCEDWLDKNNCDFALFPATGSVGTADVNIDYGSAEHVSHKDIKSINDNQSIRYCGLPTVTISIGEMQSNNMPIGLVFAGKSGEDFKLLEWARAYEKTNLGRASLKWIPPLKTDFVETVPTVDIAEKPDGAALARKSSEAPELVVERCQFVRTGKRRQNDEETHCPIQIDGYVAVKETCFTDERQERLVIEIFIDALQVSPDQISVRKLEGSMTGRIVFDFSCNASVCMKSRRGQDAGMKRSTIIDSKTVGDSNMVTVLARIGSRGQPNGFMSLL